MTIAPSRRCEFCGYDLRGISSRECPECGESPLITLRIADTRAFHIARAALEQAGLLRQCIDPKGLADYQNLGATSPGYLRVNETNLRQAEELLDQHRVVWIEDSTSLIDPLDPRCPQCGREFDEIGVSECPHCRHRVYWLAATDGIGPDDDVVCPHCLDEVTLIDGRCPKCRAVLAESSADEPAA